MTAPSSIRVLLAHIIDYAGPFPPASLTLNDAMAQYGRELSGSDAWLLGRFVVAEKSLDAVANADWSASPTEWPLTVIAGPDPQAALARAKAFNSRCAGHATVASVEFSAMPPEDIGAVARLAGEQIDVFFETPIDADLPTRLDAIRAAARAAAKVRTGGTTSSAIPTPAALADFLYECAQRRLPFKATAGLHHAVRSCYPLTYERNGPTAVMHGFLNVAAAATLAAADAGRTAIEDALVEPSAAALMDIARVCDVTATRQLFRSFGSCAFREPADELVNFLRPTLGQRPAH